MQLLMETNIYDVSETIIIVGSCLKKMEPEGFKKLESISNSIYSLCLENTHLNMAISKIGSMLRTKKIKKIIFATLDKSPHCIQMHYIQNELCKMMDLSDIEIENYVVIDSKLIKISPKVISLSKNLQELNNLCGEYQ